MKSESELQRMSIDQLRFYHAVIDTHQKQIWTLIKYKEAWGKN